MRGLGDEAGASRRSAASCPESIRRRGSSAPFTATSIVGPRIELLQPRRSASWWPCRRRDRSSTPPAGRPGSPACAPPAPCRDSQPRRPRRPPSAPPRSRIREPSARSVEKVCRIGLRSASPLVSISTRPKCGILPRSRSATSRRSAICRSVRVLQHRQPLPSSVTSSVLARSSASSMPSEPNSLTISAVPRALRRFQKSPHQRGLPGAEKAGDDGDRQPRAALALLPPAEPAGRRRGKQVEDGVG